MSLFSSRCDEGGDLADLEEISNRSSTDGVPVVNVSVETHWHLCLFLLEVSFKYIRVRPLPTSMSVSQLFEQYLTSVTGS